MSKAKRLKGAGRKMKSEDLENAVISWIWEMRSKQVSRRLVMLKAKAVNVQLGVDPTFKASSGWIQRFMNRNGLTLRRATGNPQNPVRAAHRIADYLCHLSSLRKKYKYELSNIVAMDETPVFLDMPGSTTVDTIGERAVPVEFRKYARSFHRLLGCQGQWHEAQTFHHLQQGLP
jgi:hypothetical protein